MKTDVKIIEVNASKKYQVIIGASILSSIGERLNALLPKCKIALITDNVVDALYSDCVANSLQSCGYTVVKYVFKKGEKSKNVNTYIDILNFLAENSLTRTDALVALGGGVVGDMAGFVSATYLRGIKYVQVPTTLLSQIDSSVGGKTAIDLDAGKNLVGAFCQPELVLCDTETLNTLPREIFNDGLGEVVKYALLDNKIFDLIKKDYDINELVYLCVDYKRKVVEADEFEGGQRRLLNLGHTPAHAIEKLSNYNILHGTAVAMGVRIMLKSSLNHGFINQSVYSQILKVLDKCVTVGDCPFSAEELANVALSDKKRSGDFITIIIVRGVGDCLPVKISVEQLAEYLK